MLTPPEGQRVAATVSSDSGGGQKAGHGADPHPIADQRIPNQDVQVPSKEHDRLVFTKVLESCCQLSAFLAPSVFPTGCILNKSPF